LVRLVRAALPLERNQIRCTSLDGHRLDGGARTSDEIRREVCEAEVFVGLISRNGFASAWVLFELGARWGVARILIPLLGPSVPPEVLKGPITDYNALRCDSISDLQKLVDQMAKTLSCAVKPPQEYLPEIENLATFRIDQITEEDARAVLRFFIEHPGRPFYCGSVAHKLGWQKGRVPPVAQHLADEGLLEVVYDTYGPTYLLSEAGRGEVGALEERE
jgi:hypothetical protein